jgi:hypothetical protein
VIIEPRTAPAETCTQEPLFVQSFNVSLIGTVAPVMTARRIMIMDKACGRTRCFANGS